MERRGSRAALSPVTRTDVWGGGGGSEGREQGSREGQRHHLVGGKGDEGGEKRERDGGGGTGGGGGGRCRRPREADQLIKLGTKSERSGTQGDDRGNKSAATQMIKASKAQRDFLKSSITSFPRQSLCAAAFSAASDRQSGAVLIQILKKTRIK